MIVTSDFRELRFNTAIAELIGLTSHAARIAGEADGLPRQLAEPLVLMVAPLAPHIAEELWSRLGHADSLTYAAFPEADEALAADPTVTIPVQVNGRVRFTIEVPAGADEVHIERELRSTPALTVALAGKDLDPARHRSGQDCQRRDPIGPLAGPKCGEPLASRLLGGVRQQLSNHGPKNCDPARHLPRNARPLIRERLDRAPEEDLCLSELTGPDGGELHVAMPLAGLKQVLVHDEDPVIARGHELHDLLSHDAVRGREALFEEVSLADVIVLRAGEDVILSQEPIHGSAILGDVGLERSANNVRVRHDSSPVRVDGHEASLAPALRPVRVDDQ